MNSTSALCLQQNKPCTCVRLEGVHRIKLEFWGKKKDNSEWDCSEVFHSFESDVLEHGMFKRGKHVVIIAFRCSTGAKLSPTLVTLKQPFFFCLFAYLASQHSVTWHGSCSCVFCYRNVTYRSRAEKGEGGKQTTKMYYTGNWAWFKNC